MPDYVRKLAAMKRDEERRKNVQQAIADIERVAQGLPQNPNLTRSLAIVLLETLKEASRASRDAEDIRTGVRALLRALATDHEEVKAFLRDPNYFESRKDDWPR